MFDIIEKHIKLLKLYYRHSKGENAKIFAKPLLAAGHSNRPLSKQETHFCIHLRLWLLSYIIYNQRGNSVASKPLSLDWTGFFSGAGNFGRGPI